jgi:hypothetical protein
VAGVALPAAAGVQAAHANLRGYDIIQSHTTGEGRGGNVGWYFADWQDRKHGDARIGDQRI